MNQNIKKTRSSAGTLKRAAETGTVCETASTSASYNTTTAAGRQMGIAPLLLHGQANAIPLRHLKQLTGLPDRTVRILIERERRQGVPILSDNKRGYFLPANQTEVERFIQSMRRRASEILTTAAEVGKCCTKSGGDFSDISPEFFRDKEDSCGRK